MNSLFAETNIRLISKSKYFKAETKNGRVINFPSGTRATKTEEGLIIYDHNRNIYDLFKVKDKSILESAIPSSCKINNSNAEVFFNEAKESIGQIRKSNLGQCKRTYDYLIKDYPDSAKAYEDCEANFKKNSPEFYSLLEGVESKLLKLKADKNTNERLEEKLIKHNKLLFSDDPSSIKIQKFSQLLKDNYDPISKHKKFSDSTAFIPITLGWIYSNTELKDWYEKEWTGKGFLSPFKGNSGEGITFTANPELYKQMKDKMIELQKKVLAMGLSEAAFGEKKVLCSKCDESLTKPILNGPEYEWLVNMNLEKRSRLIFIHNETVEKEDSLWQDYIPTDQSISCFKSNSLFSTIIHEANVNADNMEFFPADTHGASQDASVLEKMKLQETDLHSFKSLISREHYLQLIYLQVILSH